ncbi:exodeoxyribonuclease VII small subunit [Olsenella sp. An293]|uniref:exodeoxyribonuclease VII small subunit n=1 Tax=Olsenella sp. An293 TaxID=1965626 RepID=UPI000B36B0F3|nr:exodeoxyribonuclease VII small subunit [Olsenella sp. An293]OUO33344.1 exodeoxyribonuclease VII [Olsenella sp. An293]
MARIDVSQYQTFGDITERLDDIVAQVRDKDVSLERSLDLFDEAIVLGSKAVSLVDATDFSPEEEARLAVEPPSEDAAEKDGEPEVPAGEERPDEPAGDGR